MSTNRHVESIIGKLPEWPSGILHGIRETLRREPAKKLRHVEISIKTNPPPADLSAREAGKLLTGLGIKPQH